MAHKPGSNVEIVKAQEQSGAGTVNNLRERLDATLRCGRGKIVIDMAGVEYLDGNQLSTLAGAWRTARRYGGNLALVNTCPRVHTLLRLTRLARVMPVFDDKSTAVASLS